LSDSSELKTQELTAIIQEIRDRVRTRHPIGQAGSLTVPLPDLMPVVHARDAAEAKVAAIGTVNPRPPGAVNSLIQSVKRNIARSLNWFVRDQVEFNRASLQCVEALLQSLGEANRVIAELAKRIDEVDKHSQQRSEELKWEAGELKDMRVHWARWREDWERKLSTNEVQFLRSVAELQGAFQHRTTHLESNFRAATKAQHTEFNASLQKGILDVQQRLWADLERVRLEYERIIHNELRTMRQRAIAVPPSAPAVAGAGPSMDYGHFSLRFRGTREYVIEKQRFYLPIFEGRREVVDIGCGRGEFLELMRGAGVATRGIDLDDESIAYCKAEGLDVEKADLFAYLDSLPRGSVDGIFSCQVVEHLPPDRLPEFIRLASQALLPGGVIALETPNPECLAIFATHFYLDPTHTRPIPPQLLTFYCEEYGLGRIEVHRLSPAIETMPELGELPAAFRDRFFGALDYSVVARKL
jgi:2-polyprenyl-3-methyl-5-hydroxy-6-metoxy-1,4-benzoquinol methylase